MGSKPLLIKELPEQERPRERLAQQGAGQLSNAELLALILGTGNQGESAVHLAERLLATFGDLRGLLACSVTELQTIPGIGPARASQLVAIVELSARMAAARQQQTTIRQPADVQALLMPRLQHKTQEEFILLVLDTKNKVLAVEDVFRGSLNASIVHPREVFKKAISRSGAAIIVAHNHPSGDPTPSREDMEVTRRLVEAGKIIGIEVLDHVVFGDGKTVSMKEKGLV